MIVKWRLKHEELGENFPNSLMPESTQCVQEVECSLVLLKYVSGVGSGGWSGLKEKIK